MQIMILPTIYVTVLLLTLVLCFIKNNWPLKYRKVLININLVLLLMMIMNLSLFNLSGVWLDRVIAIAFLLTASAIFAVYRKTLQTWQKIFYGLFLFYPVLTPLTFFIDRLGFILALSPLLATLIIPETRYENQKYEIRSPIGLMAGQRLQLVEKGIITETFLGICNDGDVVSLDISNVEINKNNK